MDKKTYKLKDFAEPIAVAVTDPQKSSHNIFVGLEHYDSGEPVISRFSDTSLLNSSCKEFQKNDILIARRNVYLRRAGIAPFDGLTSGDSIVLRLFEDCEERTGISYDIAIKIIPFVLNSNSFWLYANRHADGMNSKRISKEKVLDYEFNLPSLAEQKVLAEKLWAAYEVKQSYLKMIDATEEMVKSQFIEMFDGDKYHQMELDSIAEVWLKGQAFKKDNICEEGTNFCIHYGELFTKYGPIIYDVSSTTNDEIMKASKSGDILFPASDVTPDGLARCSAIMRDEVLLGGDIIVLRPKQGNNPEYLSWAINMQKEQLLKRVTGSVVRHMSAKGLKTVRIPIAPIEEQEQFIYIVNQADKSEIELRKSVDAIDKVIKSLINENL